MNVPPKESWSFVWRALGRTLTFRLQREEVEAYGWRCLLLGLGFVWLVGIGRRWDDLEAEPLARLGVGSLAYVLFLAGLLWVVVQPASDRRVTYVQMLTFVSMTAPPGVVYAIPVEWWTTADMAVMLNGSALTFVAIYRVGMLACFNRRAAGLPVWGTVLVTLTPLMLIMVALGATRLGPVVMRGMAGIRQGAPTAAERMDEIVFALGAYALLALPVVGTCYLIWIGVRQSRRGAIPQEVRDECTSA